MEITDIPEEEEDLEEEKGTELKLNSNQTVLEIEILPSHPDHPDFPGR